MQKNISFMKALFLGHLIEDFFIVRKHMNCIYLVWEFRQCQKAGNVLLWVVENLK